MVTGYLTPHATGRSRPKHFANPRSHRCGRTQMWRLSEVATTDALSTQLEGKLADVQANPNVDLALVSMTQAQSAQLLKGFGPRSRRLPRRRRLLRYYPIVAERGTKLQSRTAPTSSSG